MLRICLEPRCSAPVHRKGRCLRHSRSGWRTKKQGRRGNFVYATKRWQILRRRVLFEQPLCRCGELATDVHHIHGVEADPWSRAGLEALCHECHSRLSAREQIAR